MKSYSRLTIDMTPEEHTYLKMASAQLGISMREFVLTAAFQKMSQSDDRWLAEKAMEVSKQFESWKSGPQEMLTKN